MRNRSDLPRFLAVIGALSFSAVAGGLAHAGEHGPEASPTPAPTPSTGGGGSEGQLSVTVIDPREEVMLSPGQSWFFGPSGGPTDCHDPEGPACIGISAAGATASLGERANGITGDLRWLPTPQVALGLSFGHLQAPHVSYFPALATVTFYLGSLGTSALVPYAKVGAGFDTIEVDDLIPLDDVTAFEGSLGGGLELRLGHHWAIDAEVAYVQRRIIHESMVNTTDVPAGVDPLATDQVSSEGGISNSLALALYF
jgi:hypothetical protein